MELKFLKWKKHKHEINTKTSYSFDLVSLK